MSPKPTRPGRYPNFRKALRKFYDTVPDVEIQHPSDGGLAALLAGFAGGEFDDPDSNRLEPIYRFR
jgi:hypothetical protein